MNTVPKVIAPKKLPKKTTPPATAMAVPILRASKKVSHHDRSSSCSSTGPLFPGEQILTDLLGNEDHGQFDGAFLGFGEFLLPVPFEVTQFFPGLFRCHQVLRGVVGDVARCVAEEWKCLPKAFRLLIILYLQTFTMQLSKN